ncbi:MAG: dihydrofolate reductase family protein [Candidatus Shapirobacteria bacterium]
MVSVISVNGKTTNNYDSNIYKWTSKEDKSYFLKLKESSTVLIMGRKTYDSVKSNIVLTQNTLRVVVTNNPNKFLDSCVLNQLEFTDNAPKDIIRNLESRGHKKALLVGGSQIYTIFLKEKLVDKMILTVEPKMFGEGHNLICDNFGINLQLTKIEQINKQGTLLCFYDVVV